VLLVSQAFAAKFLGELVYQKPLGRLLEDVFQLRPREPVVAIICPDMVSIIELARRASSPAIVAL
jgi:hypothetical protein